MEVKVSAKDDPHRGQNWGKWSRKCKTSKIFPNNLTTKYTADQTWHALGPRRCRPFLGTYLGYHANFYPSVVFDTLRSSNPIQNPSKRYTWWPRPSRLQSSPWRAKTVWSLAKVGFTHQKDSLGKSHQFKAPPPKRNCSAFHFRVQDKTTSRSVQAHHQPSEKAYAILCCQGNP